MVDLETCTVTVAWQLQALPYLDKDDHAAEENRSESGQQNG